MRAAGWIAAAALLTACGTPSGPAPGAPPVSGRALVLLVGDSTMAPETGYGDALCARLAPVADCLNLGRGGRSSMSYRAEGLWDRVLARVAASPPGTRATVLVQFGHNDQRGKPGRSTDLATEFPRHLARYVQELQAAGATPVLVTPLVRRGFRDGQHVDDLAPWAASTLQVAQAHGVKTVDLHAMSRRAVMAMGSAAADELAQGPPGDPGFDRTHLGPRGACVFSALVMKGMVAAGLVGTGRGQPVPATPDCAAVPPPGPDARRSALHPAGLGTEGWAVGTMGGRFGRIERVTTLAASGPGSLRAALDAPGARTIVFEVGGIIDLGGQTLRLSQPFVTVAGQTAPHPGVTLVRGGLDIATHDVIVQHLAIRPGAYGRARRSGPDHDGLGTLGGSHHVIVDHCSFTWATDENLSASGPRFAGEGPEAWRRATSHSITFSHNLIAEGLSDSVHPKGEHSKGTLVHDNASGVLLLGNVFVSNRERNPLFKGGTRGAVVNNLIVNPGRRAVHYNLWAGEWTGQPHAVGQLAVVGNVLRHGPDTDPETPLFGLGGDAPLELQLHDNLAWRRDGSAAPVEGRYRAGAAAVAVAPPADRPLLPPRLPRLPAAEIEAVLPAMVGARPWDRDPIDERILAGVTGLAAAQRTSGTAAAVPPRIIDDEAQVGGLPRHAATSRAFDPSAWDLRTMTPRAGWASLRR
jgi:lysophospholipase L1-like esterase